MSRRTENSAPRHALECELTPHLPDARVRAAMAAFYKSSAKYAQQQATHRPEYFGRLLDVMNAVLPHAKLEILEIGAGSAAAMRSFLGVRPQAKAIAVELSSALLRGGLESGTPSLSVVAGNALQLPFLNRAVDAVVAFEVMEHLPDVTQAIDEVLRVIRRPGYIIIGLPNHASLWTPLEDALRRRSRRAFGVEAGSGAWRWWKRNAALTLRKRLSRQAQFLYREPILDAVQGGDADAVYYAAPLDLMRYLRSRGARLVTSSIHLRLGPLGSLVPVELQGSTVMAWRCE